MERGSGRDGEGGVRRDCVERDAEKGMRTVGDVCFLTH